MISSARPVASRVAISTIFAINGLAFANWMTRIPDVKAHLGLTDGRLGLALMCSAVGALIAQPTAGWLIARYGSQKLTMMGALLFGVAISLPGLANCMPALMAILLFVGATNGIMDVSMNAQAASIEEGYGKPIMSSFHGMWSVGGLVGALMGKGVLELGVQPSTHMLGVGVLVIIVVLACTPKFFHAPPQNDHAGPIFVLPPRNLLVMGFMAFCALVCEGAIGDWSSIYLRDILSANVGLAANGVAAFAIAMAVARFLGDGLNAKLGPVMLTRLSGALVLIGSYLVVSAQQPWTAIIGFGFVGAGVACVFPLILSAASQIPTMASGVAIASMATCGYTGFLVGPPLFGSLSSLITLRWALGFTAVAGLSLVLFAQSTAIHRKESEMAR